MKAGLIFILSVAAAVSAQAPEGKLPAEEASASEESPSLEEVRRQIPSCAVNCVHTSLREMNLCDVGDLECTCKPSTLDRVRVHASPCINKRCGKKASEYHLTVEGTLYSVISTNRHQKKNQNKPSLLVANSAPLRTQSNRVKLHLMDQ